MIFNPRNKRNPNHLEGESTDDEMSTTHDETTWRDTLATVTSLNAKLFDDVEDDFSSLQVIYFTD